MRTCELELDQLDMVINARESCCLRIGALNNALCMRLSLTTGAIILWFDEIRYLGIFIVRSRFYKCSIDHVKKSFCRAADAVFTNVGHIASEEVTLQLIRSKFLPVLLYGLEELAP